MVTPQSFACIQSSHSPHLHTRGCSHLTDLGKGRQLLFFILPKLFFLSAAFQFEGFKLSESDSFQVSDANENVQSSGPPALIGGPPFRIHCPLLYLSFCPRVAFHDVTRGEGWADADGRVDHLCTDDVIVLVFILLFFSASYPVRC